MTDLNEIRQRISLTALAEEAGAKFDSNVSKPVPMPSPKQYVPPAQWKSRAAEIIAYAEQNLNDVALEYIIKERGLSPETARAFHVGYNPKNIFEDPSRWGLEGKKIWLPRGIVIPGFWKNEPSYIKIRRPLENDALERYIPNGRQRMAHQM
jgi:hypothetical protein